MNEDIRLPESYYESRQELAFMMLGTGVVEISDSKLAFEINKITPPLSRLAARCMAHIRLGKRLSCDTVYGHDKVDVELAEAFSHAAGVKRIELGIHPSGHRCSVVARHHGGPIGAHKVLILRDQVKTGATISKAAIEIRETGAEANMPSHSSTAATTPLKRSHGRISSCIRSSPRMTCSTSSSMLAGFPNIAGRPSRGRRRSLDHLPSWNPSPWRRILHFMPAVL